MTLVITLEQAKLIHKNMRSMFVMPDEQKLVYDFVAMLEHRIFQEESPAYNESHNNGK